MFFFLLDASDEVLLFFLDSLELESEFIGNKLFLNFALVGLKTQRYGLVVVSYNFSLAFLGSLDLPLAFIVLKANSLDHFNQLGLGQIGEIAIF